MTTNTKEYTREYYLKNKDRMKEISRKWRRKNKEYFIAYRLKNKEHMKNTSTIENNGQNK